MLSLIETPELQIYQVYVYLSVRKCLFARAMGNSKSCLELHASSSVSGKSNVEPDVVVVDLGLGLEGGVTVDLLASGLEGDNLSLELGNNSSLLGNPVNSLEGQGVLGLAVTDNGGDSHGSAGQLVGGKAGVGDLVEDGVVDLVTVGALVVVRLADLGRLLGLLDPELGDTVLGVNGGVELKVDKQLARAERGT